MQLRYVYAKYKTLAQAEAALEDFFAAGEILPSECPEIEQHRLHVGAKAQYRYVITLPA